MKAYSNDEFEDGEESHQRESGGPAAHKLRAFKRREQRATAILRILRKTAKRQRRKQPESCFYNRDVSRRFHVSPTTAARIFAKLRSEGLLRIIWGSQTLIEPTQLNKRMRIRGVVALPACLRYFCAIRDYRTFFLSMREALWKLGFATRLIFYEGREAEEPGFAELLLDYKVDVVIWFLPSPKIKETKARLFDRGIRLITVADSCTTAGEHRYGVDRRCALKEGLSVWQREGISLVAVLRSVNCETAGEIAIIEECLREAAMPYAFLRIDFGARLESLLTLPYLSNCTVIVPSTELAVRLAQQDPSDSAKLLKQPRLMFMEGAIDLPGVVPNVPINTIAVDWGAVAYRIGIDLVSLKGPPRGKPVIFKTKFVCGSRINGSA